MNEKAKMYTYTVFDVETPNRANDRMSAIGITVNTMLTEIYADEGITGTCTDKRDEFNRMMNDARNERYRYYGHWRR